MDICNLGSSHGEFGYDYTELTGYNCFNFGLVGQTILYDKIILEHYKSHIKEGTIVFVTLSYFEYYWVENTNDPEYISRNRRYYRFLYPNEIIGWDLNQAVIEAVPAWNQYGRLIAVMSGKLKETEKIESTHWYDSAVLGSNLDEEVYGAG